MKSLLDILMAFGVLVVLWLVVVKVAIVLTDRSMRRQQVPRPPTDALSDIWQNRA